MQFDRDELKIIGISSSVWMKLLQDREEKILRKMYGEFRAGKTDMLPLIAEFCVIRDQKHEIKTALNAEQQGET